MEFDKEINDGNLKIYCSNNLEKKIVNKIDENDFETIDKMFKDFIIEESKYDNNFNNDFQFNSLKKRLDDSIIILAYTEDNIIKGFIYGTIIDSQININKILRINFLYVDKQYRKKGIATELIRNIEKIALNCGIKYIEVQAFTNNIKSTNLYQKNKFNSYTTTFRKQL